MPRMWPPAEGREECEVRGIFLQFQDSIANPIIVVISLASTILCNTSAARNSAVLTALQNELIWVAITAQSTRGTSHTSARFVEQVTTVRTTSIDISTLAPAILSVTSTFNRQRYYHQRSRDPARIHHWWFRFLIVLLTRLMVRGALGNAEKTGQDAATLYILCVFSTFPFSGCAAHRTPGWVVARFPFSFDLWTAGILLFLFICHES